MGNLDETLSKKIKQLGIERQVEAVGVVEDAVKEITKIVPREDFEVVSYKNEVLKVSVTSSVAASELQGQTRWLTTRLKKDGYKINRVKIEIR